MSEEYTYEIKYQPTGRVWTLRQIPAHIYILYGQMPTTLSELAAKAITENNKELLAEELQKTLSLSLFKI